MHNCDQERRTGEKNVNTVTFKSLKGGTFSCNQTNDKVTRRQVEQYRYIANRDGLNAAKAWAKNQKKRRLTPKSKGVNRSKYRRTHQK